MKIGLLQLPAGISGDMFLGALVDAGAPLAEMERAVRAVGGDRLSLASREVLRAGLRGVKVDVLVDGEVLHEPGGPEDDAGASRALPPQHLSSPEPPGAHGHHHGPGHPHDPNEPRVPEQRHAHGHSHDAEHPHGPEHSHRSHREIVELLTAADLDASVRRDSLAVFRRLAEVEAALHGTTPDEVHFHEVGSWDAIADVVGAVAGVQALGLGALHHGPVAVGGGVVRAAHGALPVPAPATLELLKGRPCRQEEGVGELTTPTGAALLAVLATPAPAALEWSPARVGYGAGSRDPRAFPNLARLLVGEAAPGDATASGRVAVVEAALDDTTPEDGGYLLASLMEAGALDATLSPLIMKKGRPGFLVRLVVPAGRGEHFADLLLHRSSTLGARWREEDRRELPRRIDRVSLPGGGEVRVKVAILPDGSERPHVEFEDLRDLARTRGEAPAALRREVERLWEAGR